MMTSQRNPRWAAHRVPIAVVMALAMTVLGACLSPGPDPAANLDDPCSVMVQPGTVTSAGATNAILIDRSGSTVADDPAAFVPDWAVSLRAVLPITSGEHYLVVPFAGSGRYLSWPDGPLIAPLIRGTAERQAPKRTAVRECLTRQMQNAVLKPGVSGRTDILGALDAAGAQLTSIPGAVKRIYLATDGYPSVGCARVKIGQVLTDDDVTRIVEDCGAEIPQNLRGIPITIVGLGTTSSQMPAARPGAVASLTRLWDALCRRMTQNCVVHSGAATDDAPTTAPETTD